MTPGKLASNISNHDAFLHELRETPVLITGGTGFIGNHLVQRLASLGVTPSLFVLDYERQSLPKRSAIYHGDLASLHDCLRIIGRSNPEILFHLAAQPLVDTALDSVIDTMESNIRGAYNLLEACRSVGKRIRAVIWVSTDKVYGPQSDSLTENSPLLGFDHPYNTSKLCGDLLAQTYANVFGLPIVIVRSGNIYGEGDLHWNRIIPGTIRSVLHNRQPMIRSDGLNKRDYIHVADIVHGYLLALKGLVAGKILRASVINFGASQSYTVLDVVHKILATLGRSDLQPLIMNHARSEILEQHVDFQRARDLLGWTPTIDIDAGLRQTAEWYKNYFQSETIEVAREVV